MEKEAYPLDLTILNSFIILTSCTSKSLQRQFDIGDGPNTKGGKGASTTDCNTRKTSPMHEKQKDLIQFTTNAGLFNVSIKCHVCSDINKETGTKFSCP
jgi:hypothetical protein